MAQKKCKECGYEISNKAKTCIKCRAPVKKSLVEKEISLPVVIIALVSAIIAVSFLADKFSEKSSPKNKVKTTANKNIPPACDNSTALTGKIYNILGSDIYVYKSPSLSAEKIINKKATKVLKKTQYIAVDSSTTVIEECKKGEWSWIRVITPDWLKDTHKGWIASKYLDKGQVTGENKYSRKIGSYALSPYTQKGYPTTVEKFGSRLPEIESLRKQAAEMAIDSGKCDYVEMTELSNKKSSINELHFWVDCRNKQRIYLSEFQIKKRAQVLTQQELSWNEESALKACKEEIKRRALIPSEVDFHEILGTTFSKAEITHNAVLKINFDAKNAFGTTLPYIATCHFEPGSVGTIDVQPRQ